MTLNVITEKRERPFSCGSQSSDWESSNCDRCTKRIPDGGDYTQFKCDIQRALGLAFMTDGAVSPDIARRMGYAENPTSYVWQCGEVDWTPEWRAEYAYRRTWGYRIRLAIWKVRCAWRKWYQEKRRKIIESYRMPTALEHVEPETSGCWADWCTWALDMSDKPELDDMANRCRRDAMETGHCYCGKFTRKTPTKAISTGDSAGKEVK